MAADLNTPAPTRRGLLSAGAALAALPASAGGAASSPPLPADAALFRLREAAATAYAAYSDALERYCDAGEVGDRAAEQTAARDARPVWDTFRAALGAMAELPAETPAGMAAKLDAIGAFHVFPVQFNDEEIALLASARADAARFLAALPGLPAGLPVPRSMDARLLDLCDQWAELGEALAEGEAEDPAIAARFRATLDSIIAEPAFTRAGHRAKAEILAAYVERRDDPLSALAASLAQDLMADRAG
jgi:hypothetical protein